MGFGARSASPDNIDHGKQNWIDSNQPATIARRGERLLDQIGNTPLLRIERVVRGISERRILRQGGMVQSGRLGEGPRRVLNDPRRRAARRACAPAKRFSTRPAEIRESPTPWSARRSAIRVKFCLPTSASPERKQILQAYGAEIVYTPATKAPTARSAACAKFMRPSRKIFLSRISTATRRIRRRTTRPPGPKFGSRPRGRITHFVAGLGTSGTFVGTTRRLKELNPRDSLHQHPAGFRFPRPGRA